MHAPTYIAGIDIGGTNIRCALAHTHHPDQILAFRQWDTPVPAEPHGLVATIAAQLEACIAEAGIGHADLLAAGCAAPGITDADAGIVHLATNLNWSEVPLAQLLERHLGIPTFVENDVRAAAMGEYHYGAGRGCSSLVYYTVSTGVSAGIVIDGRPVRGHHHGAGELGFFVPDPALLDRDWSPNGCLELTSAGIGLARSWVPQVDRQHATVTAEDVFEAAAAGDEAAATLVDRATDQLAQTALALCCILDPQVLVLGGSIALHVPQVAARMRQVLGAHLPVSIPVTVSALGDRSPLVGALSLAHRHTHAPVTSTAL